MIKTIVIGLSTAIVVSLAALHATRAQEAEVPTVLARTEPVKSAPVYADVLKTCGARWKVSEDRKATVKGEGVKAWQVYRAACVTESGYVKRR